MGTNVQLNSPVCIDRNNQTLGGSFKLTPEVVDYLQRPSGNSMLMSDSGIQLDLIHEDDDLTDLNNYSVGEMKDRNDLAAMSQASNEVKSEPSSSNQGSHEKGCDSSSLVHSDSSGKSVAVHRSKGRPTKLTNGSSGPRGIIQCPVCNKMFNNSSALAKHKLIHSDERKYSCPLCSKAFKRQDHLNGHMMTHSSKKPYECKFINCDKSYCDQRSLRRHIENHHQQYLDCSTPTSAGEAALLSGESVFQFDASFLSQFPGSSSSSGEPGGTAVLNSPALSVGVSPTVASQKATWLFGYNPLDEPKPVRCAVCERRFKNLPALNGHMRLHGGFVKKDLTESENRTEDSKTLISENDCAASVENKEPVSQPSLGSWPSEEEMVLRPESISMKQEDLGEEQTTDRSFDLTDDLGKSASRYPEYILTSEQQAQNEDFKHSFFIDSQNTKVKDNAEHQMSIASETKHFLANSLLDDQNSSENNFKRSFSEQVLLYPECKYSICDNQAIDFSSISAGNLSQVSGETKQMEATESSVDTSATAPSVSRYKIIGSSGSCLTAQINQSANNSLMHGNSSMNCQTSTSGLPLYKNLLSGGRVRKNLGRPLTPSYAVSHGYAPVLHRSISAAFCGSSTPCTPHSPFAARAVYPASCNQPQTSNSNFFQFPPQTVALESGILNHTVSTPIHAGYGMSQQHTPHTPLSPYTPQPNAPYTPKTLTSSGRLSRFQFPPVSGLMDSGTCESPYSHQYQKSTYHPYSHHAPPLLSPHHMNLQQRKIQEEDFKRDVMQVEKEIAQRLNLLLQEEARNVSSPHCNQVLFDPGLVSDLGGRSHQSVLQEQKEQKSRIAGLGLGQSSRLVDNSNCDVPTVQKQNLPMLQQMLGKCMIQEDFLNEKMDQTSNDFDMDLELDSLNILNSNVMNILDRKQRFSEVSADPNLNDIGQFDVLDLILQDTSFGDVSSEMVVDDLPNVDMLSSSNEPVSTNCANFGTGNTSDSMLSSGVMIAPGDQRVKQTTSVPVWIDQEIPSQFDVNSGLTKEEIFLNPNKLDRLKKKKHRPGPIVIPPSVNNYQTVTSHLFSPHVVDCLRQTSLPPPIPPPPYTAQPLKSPADNGCRSFQVVMGKATPQSAPTFRFMEAKQLCEQNNEMINGDKVAFSWDQNVLDSFVEQQVNRFQDSTCYTPISNGAIAKDQVDMCILSKSKAPQDAISRYGSNGLNAINCQDFGNWKLDEMKAYRQSLLENDKLL